MKSFEHHHLEVERDGDCFILRQTDHSGNTEGVALHVSQLRYVAEVAGVVQSNYPDDELSKRLAEQLCTILRELGGECHRSHWIELTYTKLDAWCSALPDNIFPHHLWDDEPEKPAPAKRLQDEPSASAVASAEPASRPIPSTPTKQPAGQLGFEV